MTSRATTRADRTGRAGAGAPVVVMRRRADFLKANGGKRRGMPGFLLQARKRKPGEAPDELIRVGFTCSKKVGNAVARNRAKRRLREIARAVLPSEGRAGFDYVLIGRAVETSERAFQILRDDLRAALKGIHPEV